MTKEQFYRLLDHPDLLDENTLSLLDKLIEEYPYFQAARYLYLRNLHNIQDISFNKALKNYSAVTSRRKSLFQFIQSPVIADYPLEAEKQPEEEVQKPAKHSGRARRKLLYLVTEQRNYGLDYLEQTYASGGSDYLSKFLSEEGHIPSSQENEDLISRFIREYPRISKPDEKQPASRAAEKEPVSKDENSGLMTETLARIYMNQHLYDKAIQAYEKLSLNYPEKSIYFALQIKKIEELRNQSNS